MILKYTITCTVSSVSPLRPILKFWEHNILQTFGTVASETMFHVLEAELVRHVAFRFSVPSQSHVFIILFKKKREYKIIVGKRTRKFLLQNECPQFYSQLILMNKQWIMLKRKDQFRQTIGNKSIDISDERLRHEFLSLLFSRRGQIV